MKIEVLISCMHQKDVRSLIDRTNIQSDVLVINQCDEDKSESYIFQNKRKEYCTARIIYTTERGLSRSRNMAIRNSLGDICLICDNDEYLYDNYPQIIKNEYLNNHKFNLIIFKFKGTNDNLRPYTKINYLSALKINSIDISFIRKDIINNNIFFDESLGSGVSKAGGEENKFIYDCLKNKLKIIKSDKEIGVLLDSVSCWFKGYTKEYFIDRGIMTKKLMGLIPSTLYALYFLLKKYKLYNKDLKFKNAFISLIKGIYFTK